MTLIRKVKCLTSRSGMRIVTGIVHFTSDNLGETLSIDADGIQITVRYEDIEEIVERERAKGYTDGHAIIDETGEEPEEIGKVVKKGA